MPQVAAGEAALSGCSVGCDGGCLQLLRGEGIGFQHVAQLLCFQRSPYKGSRALAVIVAHIERFDVRSVRAVINLVRGHIQAAHLAAFCELDGVVAVVFDKLFHHAAVSRLARLLIGFVEPALVVALEQTIAEDG